MRFFERLEARSRAVDSLVCVGLDPDFRKHRVEDVAAFNTAIVEATAEFAACFKPNIAFYEQWGIPGLHALEQTLKAIPAGIPVICDAKRGDMGNTAEAYARALFESWGFDCATVNGYQGSDAIAPFLAYPEKAVFVLCRTSNPGAREFQEQRLENGRLLYQQVALTATSWSPNVILVSSELPEVMNLAHRVIVMRRGRQVAEFNRGNAHAETIVAAASGLNTTAVPAHMEIAGAPA